MVVRCVFLVFIFRMDFSVMSGPFFLKFTICYILGGRRDALFEDSVFVILRVWSKIKRII